MNHDKTTHPETRHNRFIAIWLLVCCAMVFAMVILGGVTRLTGSGLSMVEWDPIFGMVPPLDETAWNETFELYQQSPEYKKINVGMDLDGFKNIYWFEFSHRVLGRTIGTVFLLPFLFFLIKGWVTRPLIPRLTGMFVLGGLQGLLGWYMVKSGLVDNPHVSQYRLTAHLGLAIVIYAYMFNVALELLQAGKRSAVVSSGSRHAITLLSMLIFITILSGGFVAGLKAGFAYNTFPLMDGHWIPEVVFMQEPWWRNFFENIATVQFDHRVLATLVFISVVILWLVSLRHTLAAPVRTGMHLLLVTAVLQVSLGISTLLLHVPVPLAAAHQAGALLLFTAALYVRHRMSTTG
ncbi:MAG: heme A synthase [Gammaproteobacteria bacterium]|nr:heme A synthase [Gammaproteobacteria bacterium]